MTTSYILAFPIVLLCKFTRALPSINCLISSQFSSQWPALSWLWSLQSGGSLLNSLWPCCGHGSSPKHSTLLLAWVSEIASSALIVRSSGTVMDYCADDGPNKCLFDCPPSKNSGCSPSVSPLRNSESGALMMDSSGSHSASDELQLSP